MNKWKITVKADSIYIENISNKKVLEIAPNGTVVEEDFEDGKIGQHWDKQGAIYLNGTLFLTVKFVGKMS